MIPKHVSYYDLGTERQLDEEATTRGLERKSSGAYDSFHGKSYYKKSMRYVRMA